METSGDMLTINNFFENDMLDVSRQFAGETRHKHFHRQSNADPIHPSQSSRASAMWKIDRLRVVVGGEHLISRKMSGKSGRIDFRCTDVMGGMFGWWIVYENRTTKNERIAFNEWWWNFCAMLCSAVEMLRRVSGLRWF